MGCPNHFDRDISPWSSTFDLGVIFSEIHHVYMDWSGEITSGLAIRYSNPDEPFPKDVGLSSYLGEPFNWRYADIWGGETFYPNTESFNELVEFIHGSMSWSELYDGQGKIIIDYEEYIMISGEYIEGGTIYLNEIYLVIDGDIIPEPTSLLLIIMCGGILRYKTRT